MVSRQDRTTSDVTTVEFVLYVKNDIDVVLLNRDIGHRPGLTWLATKDGTGGGRGFWHMGSAFEGWRRDIMEGSP